MTKTKAPAFLNYLPVPLAFGTSGLRGLVKDITDLEAYINVKGSLRYLLSRADIRAHSRVVIAGDALCSSSDETHDGTLALYHDRYGQQIETVLVDELIEAWA